jgi:hypothetical protein
MPKKKERLTPERQSEMFRKTVREKIAAGELDPIEAEAALDNLVRAASFQSHGKESKDET